MNRREMMTLTAASAALLTAGGLRAFAQSAAGTIAFGQSTAVLTLDPAHGAFTGYPGGYEAALCIYDRLLDFDGSMNIVPQLAESYEMAPDLMSCELKLRQGVKFHDGTDLDVAAVKLNLERMMDAERNPTNRPLWNPLESIETPDEQTIVIRLSAPFAQLPNTLAHGSGAIVSPAALEEHGEEGFRQNPVGAGPYKVERFEPGQSLTLVAFDDYWGGAPGARSLVFRHIAEPATRISALTTGAVDVIDAVPVQLVGQLSGDANVEIIRQPGLRPLGFALNLTREPLQDVRVRKALNLAVPLATIAERVFFGYAQVPDSPLAFDAIGYKSIGRVEADQEAARALLAEAGYTPGADGIVEKDGEPLRLTMYSPEGLFPGDLSVAEIVSASLRQVGVNAEISRIETGAYWDSLRQDAASLQWDMAMFGFNPSNGSGLYHLESLFKSNADDAARPDVWNIARYSNEEVDRLLREAGTAPDEAERNAALAEAQSIIWDESPYLWLQINENITAVRKNVGGVEVLPIVFTSLRNASV